MTKSLRPYQAQAIASISDKLQSGVDKQLCVMSMGLGKTFTAVKMTEQLGFNRVLWVTDSEDLLSQSAFAFIRDKFDESLANHIQSVGYLEYIKQGGIFANSGFSMGAIKADVFKPEGNVVMCSAQTLHRRLHLLKPDQFDCLIIDEAHCFGARTYFEGINYFNPKLRLGLTGTPERYDGVMMGDIFDEIVFNYGISEGTRDGYLAKLDGIKLKTNISLDSVHTLGGEFNQKELADEVNCPARNNMIALKYLEYAKGRQAIGFGVDISHCQDLTEAFIAHGINATCVSSNEERTGDRSQKIKDYMAGKYDVIFNVNLLVKGFDHADTGCGIMAAPTKSKTRYLQAVGRPSRLKSAGYVEKFGQNAIILDVVDLTSKHSLVNTWSLDNELPLEEKIFITAKNREKLIEARRVRIEGKTDKDEKVLLLPLPKLKISKSIKMLEEATEAQLKWIYDLGYSADIHYTKRMCSEIISQQPASQKQINLLKHHGYDVSNKIITIGDVNAAMWEVKQKLEKQK